MGVRNCADLGENLQKIVRRLMANDNLVNLLYYEDKNPLNKEHLTEDQKNKEVFNKLIKIVPRTDPKDDSKSIIVVRIEHGNKLGENSEFKNVQIKIEVFVPLTQWLINDANLRPFAILGEVQKSLEGKTINGLGRLKGGDFDLNFITDEMGGYEQNYWLVSYD